MTLNYWTETWPLQVGQCPCDVHFGEYLQANGIGGKTIFHFGTGAHHVLGKINAQSPIPNEILGITASPDEYSEYIRFVIANPAAAITYKVIFADIYTMTPRMLPAFDLVTLFHLCEFYHPERSAYAPLDDERLLALFLSKLNPGGRIFWYKNSGPQRANAGATRLLEQFSQEGRIVKQDEFKSLAIYAPV
jgi:hypothetical protein